MADQSPPSALQSAADQAAAAAAAAHTQSRWATIAAGAEARTAEFFADLAGTPDVQRVITDLLVVGVNTFFGMAETAGEDAFPPLKLLEPLLQRVENALLTKAESEVVTLAAKAKAAADALAVQADVSTAPGNSGGVASFLASLGEEGIAALKAKLDIK